MLKKLMYISCMLVMFNANAYHKQQPVSPLAADIEQQQLIDLQQSDEQFLLLDVRTAEEFQEGHIPGAVNISHTELAANLQKLESYKDKNIVVYCRSGRRAGIAIEELKQQGFKHLTHLQGDMNLWHENNRQVEK
ncbi:rhodanese-like domain-containing protein [Thalassotalea sp. Y01]|uniref:rhodanese-like domain-containing protein n=1 Tax=Thalassotalea sp. Y01 TaxID=2729613 RepID=UPI001B7D6921|nr:rhodanese-like domain-containing protein [Thalassotalea sp. Y01]